MVVYVWNIEFCCCLQQMVMITSISGLSHAKNVHIILNLFKYFVHVEDHCTVFEQIIYHNIIFIIFFRIYCHQKIALKPFAFEVKTIN